MRIDTLVKGDVFEAKLSERMSFADNAPFRTLLDDVTKSGLKKCVINLSGLISIDSAGLGMFMIAQEKASKGGWSLTLKGAKGQVKSLLELGKFDKLLCIEA